MDQDLTTQMIKDLLSKVTVGDTEEETTPATTGLMSSLPGTKTPENVAKEEEANDTPKARTTISKFINDLADAREAEEAEDDTQYVTKETPEVSDILSLNTELLQNRHNTPLYDFIRKNKNINLNDGTISVRDRGDAGLEYIKRIGDMFKKDYTIPSARPDVSVQRKPSVVLDLDLFMERYDAEDEVGTADVDISIMPDAPDADGGAAPSDGKGLMSPGKSLRPRARPTEEKNFITSLEERLVELEGFKSRAYKPDEDEKFLTIGYGHYGEDVTKDMILTEKQARILLRKDINKRLPKIRKSIKNFDSLSNDLKVEIAQSWFRGGISGSPKTISLINEGKFEEAAEEFLDNDEYRTTELKGVKKRMEALSNALRLEIT